MDLDETRTTGRRTTFDDSPGSTHMLVLELVELGPRLAQLRPPGVQLGGGL